MGPLVAIGGLHVSGSNAAVLEKSLDQLCQEFGFPPGEPFKWSPGRELWMRDNLRDKDRARFMKSALVAAKDADATALVVLEDTSRKKATDAKTPEDDITRLFLERVHNLVGQNDCIVIADRPGGDRAAEDDFLSECLETRLVGTDYVKPQRVSFLVSTPSKFIRLLQLADVVTSCTTALMLTLDRHSPPTFKHVRALLRSSSDRIGGVGVKLHPDFRYANLYHWLLGDDTIWRSNVGTPLPISTFPYSKGPLDSSSGL